MNRIHKRRLFYVSFFLVGLSLAAGLIFYALSQNMNAFLTPGQLASASLAPDYHFRLGGMVKKESVVREQNGLGVNFIITDFKREVAVHYVGVLPDLFREGKGVIAEGSINTQGIFVATQILAKHDENYMPKNVAQAVEEGKKIA